MSEIVKREADIAMGERGLQITNYQEAFQIAQAAANSKALERWKSADDAFICIIAGQEIGLSPFQALQDLYPVRGKVAIMGDAAKALVMASDVCEYIISGRSEDPPGWWVESKRPGAPLVRTVFSVDDAKRAKLWGKTGPWSDYPQRMLYYRALGFHLRDQFPDVLRGMKALEEVNDYPDGEPEQGEAVVVIDDPLLEAASGPVDRPEPDTSATTIGTEFSDKPLKFKPAQIGADTDGPNAGIRTSTPEAVESPESDPKPETASEGHQERGAAEGDPRPSPEKNPPAPTFWQTRLKDEAANISKEAILEIVKTFGFDSLADLSTAGESILRSIVAAIRADNPGKTEISESDIDEALGQSV